MSNIGQLGLLFVYRGKKGVLHCVCHHVFFINISSKEFDKKFCIVIGKNGLLQGALILHKRRFGDYFPFRQLFPISAII